MVFIITFFNTFTQMSGVLNCKKIIALGGRLYSLSPGPVLHVGTKNPQRVAIDPSWCESSFPWQPFIFRKMRTVKNMLMLD